MPIPSPRTKGPALEAFGEAVRNASKERGISQEYLAHRCGIDRGAQNLGLLHLHRIALALGMSLADLMVMAKLQAREDSLKTEAKKGG